MDPIASSSHSSHAVGAGRYAPSPTGDLHLGNLRTAVLAWALARRNNLRFLMRVEDLDRVRAGSANGQLQDLASLGITWEPPVIYQHNRLDVYQAAIDELTARGLIYECYCSRKDIREATSAPHIQPGTYPGTCRNLTEDERTAQRDRLSAQNRQPALRLRAAVSEFTVHDLFAGDYTGPVDDVVVRRGDGVIAYNLAVVVDDAYQGVTQVCRGDDLLSSSPRQAYLAQLLGLPQVSYAHVPLVLNPQGDRLAKRDGAVSLRDLAQQGWSAADVLRWIAGTVGIHELSAGSSGTEAWCGHIIAEIAERMDLTAVSAGPITFTPPESRS